MVGPDIAGPGLEMSTGIGIFAPRARQGAQAEVATVFRSAEEVQQWVPARFEAVAERLAARRDTSDACAMLGRELARDGADLGQALDALRTIYARVLGGESDFRAVRVVSLAWGEGTLGYLHQLSCEDPLAGLASLAHLRARIAEVYRAAEHAETARVRSSSARRRSASAILSESLFWRTEKVCAESGSSY